MNINDLKIERKIDVDMYVRLFFIFQKHKALCADYRYSEDWRREEMETITQEHIPPHQLTKFDVRPILKTFDMTEDGLLDIVGSWYPCPCRHRDRDRQ